MLPNKYAVRIFFLEDDSLIERNFLQSAENPEQAIQAVYRKQQSYEPRPIDIGDCAVVKAMHTDLALYFIFDLPIKSKEIVDVKRVSKAEFNLWVSTMLGDPLRKLGIQAAFIEQISRIKPVSRFKDPKCFLEL